MKKEVVFLVMFVLMVSSVIAGPADEIEPAQPDTSSPPIVIVETYDAPFEYPEGLVFDGTYLWISSILDSDIYKYDPNTFTVVSKIPAPGPGSMDLAWDGEFLWNADYDNDKIYKLDIAGDIIKEFDSPGEQPQGMTWDGDNSPDPKDVDIDYGMVKYQLNNFDYYLGDEKWDISKFATGMKAKIKNEIGGVALFQLISDKKLKVEFFPGKKESEVEGFSSDAVVFER